MFSILQQRCLTPVPRSGNLLHRMVQAGNEPAVRFWLELHAPVNVKTWYAAHALAGDESAKLNLLPAMKLFPFACYGIVSSCML